MTRPADAVQALPKKELVNLLVTMQNMFQNPRSTDLSHLSPNALDALIKVLQTEGKRRQGKPTA
ncbi:hypothetical protein [Thalassococcus lentus]|uniref:Uncharacterized protein n=1 Tax=Thalassococcus lentus TaxID=1210524 RepID=A0ABT4XUT6_9RHOB|nr:hypothetical protein [Thalassococcus lentus]MDA7425578.1 hypothetical protein [Thalassococcus lentus]